MQSWSLNARGTGVENANFAQVPPLILSTIHMVMHSMVEKPSVSGVENWFSLEIRPIQAVHDKRFHPIL
ncbi:hypothetical protein [Glutamicibacter uratoxydans]|uniref:hypothetical protein n=1 Tax=Glutamicibacter uratoxydans TaxID=43667 RepID=UPI001142869F|nr:hypothetical protein [Glutamicibacter uratoxydans]